MRRGVVSVSTGPDALHFHGKEEEMYISETIWWAYTAFVVAVILFMLYFAARVRQKGG